VSGGKGSSDSEATVQNTQFKTTGFVRLHMINCSTIQSAHVLATHVASTVFKATWGTFGIDRLSGLTTKGQAKGECFLARPIQSSKFGQKTSISDWENPTCEFILSAGV
jgi:hypothetical protein